MLADPCQGSGQAKTAISRCAKILAAEAINRDLLATIMQHLQANGRVLEALQCLKALTEDCPDLDALLPAFHALAQSALDRFKHHFDAGDIAGAADYIDALAELAPGHQLFVQAAFDTNQSLQRQDKVIAYARVLLAMEPTHYVALQELATFCRASGDTRTETAHRLTIARNLPDDLHSAIKLHNIWEALNAALLHCPEQDVVALVDELTDAAHSVPPAPSSADDPYQGWETAYRLLIDAIDLPAVLAPPPEAKPYPPITFATGAGKQLSLDEVRHVAASQQAEVLFLVAADAGYVGLYARHYIVSVLEHCDTPCLIVVHVIGGSQNLPQVAASVGLEDPRLIFAADEFDPAAVQGRTYRPPPTLWCGLAAHYQSARFLWLEYYLDQLQLPMFVSDIDMLLQNGIRKILKRYESADLVLNENRFSPAYSWRLTANLLLVKPTSHARAFARVLHHHLSRALSKKEIHHMIDQCALFMARHSLSKAHGLRLAYFDTRSEVNNEIYKEYGPTPYTFFSLYHGFDLSTLSNRLDKR